MKKFFCAVLTAALLTLCAGCAPNTDKPLFGVWWWNKDLPCEKYLDFAGDNGVTEIYYCDSAFDENTANFIRRANDLKFTVYFLAGDYRWLDNPQPLYDTIERYKKFCSENADRKFEGIHLDIEPHQNPSFHNKRAELLTKLISLVNTLHGKYPDVKFDYDIPFWIEDEIDFNGKIQPAYAHIIEKADRTFIMSYRDTAQNVLNVAKEELEFAKSIGKVLVLGVETFSNEGDSVSFMEEGKAYMNGEIAKIREQLPKNCGISVHQIKTWYDLKD